MTRMRASVRFLLLTAVLISSVSAATSAYDRVMAELGPLPHRQPGSEQMATSQRVIEGILGEAGLQVHRQTFETLVPATTRMAMTVNGQDVAAKPFFMLAAGSLPSTFGKTLRGRSVYLGDGVGLVLDGKQIDGAVAVLEFGAPGIRDVMRLGAKAIILVDNDSTTQWDLARHRPVIGTPTVWLPRAQAQELGLLGSDGTDVTLDLAMTWEDRQATNLWVRIAGDGTSFNLGTPEVMVLSATLDTVGVVPDYSPHQRNLANVALLTQTLVDLAKSKPKRDIVGLYLGAHAAGEEGARHFYFPYDYVLGKTKHSLQDLAEMYRTVLAEAERFKGFLSRPDFLNDDDHPDYANMTKRLRQKIEDRSSEINYRLSQVYRLINELETEKRNVDRGKLEVVRDSWDEEYQALVAERDQRRALKSRWNDMNRQIIDRSIREEDRDIYQELLALVHGDLDRMRNDANTLLQNNACYQELFDLMNGKQIVAHFHLDLATASKQWLFNMSGYRTFHGTDKMTIGGFKKQVDEMRKIYEGIYQENWRGADLNREACELQRSPDSLAYPGLRSLPVVPAHAVAVYGYSLNNLAAPLNDDELPRRVTVDLRPMIPQIGRFIDALSAAPQLSVSYRNQHSNFGRQTVFSPNIFGNPSGMLVQTLVKGGTELAGPAVDGLVAIGSEVRSRSQWITGYLKGGMTRVNAMGMIFEPHVLNDQVSRFSFAFMLDENGRIEYRTDLPHGTRLNMRYGRGGRFATPFFPNEYDFIDQPEFLLGATDATFNPKTDYGTMDNSGGLVHMTREDTHWKVSGRDGLLLLGSRVEKRDIRDEEPKLYHVGMANDPESILNLDPIRQSSNDFSLLNEERLEILRRKNIISDAAETLNATADEYREQARELREAGHWAEAEAKELFALCYDNRAYKPTRQISNDMVKAVIILMLLCIPFAFAMERLCIGATSIYRQILGFGVVFLSTFLILYLLHPAFSLAAAPVVIFLAFVIIMMSGTVIYVVMSRFKMELMALQGLASKSHSEEGTTGTALASIFIGISGMRNRPLKTFLTAATVVLLTFTILVFASFNSSVGVVEKYLGQGSGVDRIEVHRSSYLPIPEKLIDALHYEFKDEYHIFERSGFFKDPTSEETKDLDIAVYSPRNGAFASIKAVVGLDPKETVINRDLAGVVPEWDQGATYGDDERPIWMPPYVAESMGIAIGDQLTIRGVAFTYQGPFKVGSMQAQAYISGGRFVPPDFEAIFREMEQTATTGASAAQELEKIDTSSFQWIPASDMAIVRAQDLSIFGRTRNLTNALVFYPRGDADPAVAANRIATVFNDPVFAKSSEGAQSFFFTEAFKGSGFGEVIVPLLLGGLIIFSSLLGSIVDREREIFTFSALGLSPPNVAALFFAESSVYAVIGGVGGYLVSQIVAAFLKFLASYGLFQPPEMNFSSLSSTYTILVVMATVILSTIYPAMKAGKSANPGVARKWKMPAADGNRLNFLFPFTVSSSDMAGILSFIHEHFDNHRDASLGSFAASTVAVKRLPDDPQLGEENYAIDAEVSLAPFDLGIFQRFRMSSRDSDIEGIKEVLVELELHSGSPSAWLRSNRTFIADLRKQFLLWRSLPAETVEHYCSMTVHDALLTQSIPVRNAPMVGLEGAEQVKTAPQPAVDNDDEHQA